MSAFKDAVAADIKATFINELEFADEHTVNGEPVICVVDSNITDERQVSSSEFAPGVYMDQVVLYVKQSDLPQKPVRGELLKLDNERYFVKKVADNVGVLEITLEANES